MEKKNVHGVINLCPEETITLAKLAEDIVDVCSSKSTIHCVFDEQVSVVKFTSKRAQSLLGWRAATRISDILKNYYAFMAAHK